MKALQTLSKFSQVCFSRQPANEIGCLLAFRIGVAPAWHLAGAAHDTTSVQHSAFPSLISQQSAGNGPTAAFAALNT